MAKKDIIARLKEDKTVWNNYQLFSDTYKRIRIAYIEAARKRPEEFEKRLNNFINKTRENKRITDSKNQEILTMNSMQSVFDTAP